MQPFLLNETVVLEIFGYFMLAVAVVIGIIGLVIGRVVFSTDGKTATGKILRIVFVAVAGYMLLVALGIAW